MQVSAKNIIFIVVIITIILLVVAIFILLYVGLYNKRKRKYEEEKSRMAVEFEKQLLQSRIEMQEATYSAVSKELHDNVAQLLSSSRMLLGLTERAIPNPPDTLLTANATLEKAILELRSLSKSLDKEWLEQFNFTENLQAETARINASGAIQAKFLQEQELFLPPDEQLLLFRIVQEAIQNAVKHANPKNIIITLGRRDDQYFICISDDGKGFEPDKQAGMGLANMKQRTALLGGVIDWQTKTGKGTSVTILLPLNFTDHENHDRTGG